MNQDDIQKEIAALREELEAIKAVRSNADKGSAVSSPETSPLSNLLDRIDKDEIASRLKETLKRTEQDLKASNPLTIIVVFLLGLVFGKLLSK